MAQGFRLADGRDFDQVFAQRVSGVIYGGVGYRNSAGTDLINVYENLRVSAAAATGYRKSDGVDLNSVLDTKTGSFVAFDYTSTSGDVPGTAGGQYGTAQVTVQNDGYMHIFGSWINQGWYAWFSNPQANIGSIAYVYLEPQSTPTSSQWGGNLNQWLPITSQPTATFSIKSPTSGTVTARMTVYFGFSSGQIAQISYFTMIAKGRFKDLG